MRRGVPLGLGLATLLMAASVEASTFVHMSGAELVRSSDAAVVGRVTAVESFWSASGRIVVTEARVEVDEVLFGDAPAVVVLRTFGGTVDGYSVEAHGFPEFVRGQKLLAYVRAGDGGTHEVVGYRQGQFRILTDAAGAEVAVSAVEEGVRYLRPDGSAGETPRRIALDRLRASIHEAALAAGRLR